MLITNQGQLNFQNHKFLSTTAVFSSISGNTDTSKPFAGETNLASSVIHTGAANTGILLRRKNNAMIEKRRQTYFLSIHSYLPYYNKNLQGSMTCYVKL